MNYFHAYSSFECELLIDVNFIFGERRKKMMKKSLVLTLVLSALLLVTVMAVSVSADASLTIGEVSFVKDTANNLVTFTVPYTAVEVDQITVIAVKGTGEGAPAATEDNIVYFNQQSSASDSFTFSVALNAFDATNPYCWIKVGGTAIATASSDGGQEIWVDAGVLVYGDVNDDGTVDSSDAILIIKYAGAMAVGNELDATEFPDGSFPAGALVADVSDDGAIDSSDAILIIKYAGAMAVGNELAATEFPNGRFPADK